MLARVVKQHSVVKKDAENREYVLAAIEDLNSACEECEWLSKYENDPNKYRVILSDKSTYKC